MTMWMANAAQVPLNQTIGSYHALVAHFPMVFFAASLVCDVLYYFGKTRALNVAHWLVIVGIVACMPVLFTGMAAAQAANAAEPFLAMHISLGYTTAVAASLYAGCRIAAMWWQLEVPTSFYLMASIIIIALISWTADYGWLSQEPQAPSENKQTKTISITQAKDSPARTCRNAKKSTTCKIINYITLGKI